MSAFHLLPVAASTQAARVDALFLGVLLVTGVMALTLSFLVVFLAIRYRRGAAVDRRAPPADCRPLEIAWTGATFVVFMGLFGWAARDYVEVYRPPPDAMPVFVVAKQWMWTLEHANGRREIDELHVPVGRPVRLVMTSQDAIHSFFVPAFRVKQDVLPGRYTSLWFTATRAGDYPLSCAEYCGADHAGMRGRIRALAPADFARWLEEGSAGPGLAARGFELFRRHGCSGCHAAGSTVHAPALEGLLGRAVALQDGRRVIADESYLRDAILVPGKDVVAGFAPIMPSFAGQFSEDELMALIEYLRATGKE